MHLTPVSSFTRQNLRASRQFTCQNRRQMHRLIHKAVEHQPSRTGGAAIESERKFEIGKGSVLDNGTWLNMTVSDACSPKPLMTTVSPFSDTMKTETLHGLFLLEDPDT